MKGIADHGLNKIGAQRSPIRRSVARHPVRKKVVMTPVGTRPLKITTFPKQKRNTRATFLDPGSVTPTIPGLRKASAKSQLFRRPSGKSYAAAQFQPGLTLLMAGTDFPSSRKPDWTHLTRGPLRA